MAIWNAVKNSDILVKIQKTPSQIGYYDEGIYFICLIERVFILFTSFPK